MIVLVIDYWGIFTFLTSKACCRRLDYSELTGYMKCFTFKGGGTFSAFVNTFGGGNDDEVVVAGFPGLLFRLLS